MACDYAEISADELLSVCGDCGNSRAWEELVRRFHPLVVAVVMRTTRRYVMNAAALCDDLAQEVYLKLSAHNGRVLRGFVPQHVNAAYSFIKVLTANTVHDHFKGKGKVRRHLPLPETLQHGHDLNLRLLQRDIDGLMSRRTRQPERRIFWLYYHQGLNAKEIATLPDSKLGLKGVESLLRRLKLLIRAELAGG